MTSRFLIGDLKHEEACRLRAYLDTEGVPTIGWGHASPDVHLGLTWTQDQADVALRGDVNATITGVNAKLPWWTKLDDFRQDVLAMMAFQMGVSGLLTFTGTLSAAQQGQYSLAADRMLKSKWADQTPARAARMSAQMRSGQRAWAWMDGKTS